ncbi:type II toxin-antitoxin system HipA family toxin [Luteimicrobium subarcticum]|uniref:Serine/threonine-protein kinase HipA n=1 Tax=Luteimicrobium subarcticum TaxID=620910 RepID=A0A2M8WR88_9MICO|nr:HipA domain-containing protein [Luteimicrobium subarcticum]PJI93445.1 serine/threonine-protein kinase HipA [Luteimicrobium subarcticum]
MTTSELDELFVWAWLPGAAEPVVTGRVFRSGTRFRFQYGRSYLGRPGAVALYAPELPLVRGPIDPVNNLDIAGCLDDAGPASWGQRIILARHQGRLDKTSDTGDLDRLVYFAESGSDRIGALDFQASATQYVPRTAATRADLGQLLTAADDLEEGRPLTPALAEALLRGTSIGGARPKALLDDGDRKLVAKFSSTTDTYPVVRAEGVAMNLARRVGLNVAATEVISVLNRDVLLVDRFDRGPGATRRMMVSALTMLGLHEMVARYATYVDLADLIRARFTDPGATLRELFTRIVFNVAVGNTDDHARNHAAFWDGDMLTLTPAYDVCPQVRSGGETAQAMAIGRGGERDSRFSVCVNAAAEYLLTRGQAKEIVDRVVSTIHEQWDDAAEEALLTDADRLALWHRQILNPSVFYDA